MIKVIPLFLFLYCFLDVQHFAQMLETDITINDGLSQNSARVLYQDKKGFIWIGIHDGLNRYDGYNIKVFKTNPKDYNSITGNFIKSIMEDNSQNL